MKPNINTFNTLLINDGVNFDAAFPDQGFFPQAASQSVELARSDNPPTISTVKRQSKIIRINIYPRGVFTTQINILNGYFDVNDKTLRPLVVNDENGVQWFVYARCEGQPHAYADYVQYSLRVPDPVWRRAIAINDAWNITSSPATHTITQIGNRSSYPIFNISPTTAKGAGFIYSEFRVWYNPQTTEALKDEIIDIANNAWNTSVLITDTSVSNQINQGAGIGTGLTAFPVDTAVGGGLAPVGLAKIDNEQILYTLVGSTMTPTARGVGGTTAATHLDNAVITQSRGYANGQDFRLRALAGGGAIDLPYWLTGYNTTTTKVFSVVDFAPGITLTLSGALGAVAAVTTLNFKQTATNKIMLQRLASKSNFMFVIGSEVFSFNTGVVVDVNNYKITTTAGNARAAYASTKATHADNDNVYWVEYVFQFLYGNTALSAPSQDESQNPIINKTTSTNLSFVWDTNFFDYTGLRAGNWTPTAATSPGHNSNLYTGKHTLGADTAPTILISDPSTALGNWVSAYQQGTTWRGEAAIVKWGQHSGVGFTAFTLVDALYRYSADFPALVGLQKSSDGVNWTNCTGFPEAKPVSAQVWTAGAAHNSISLGGTFKWLRWIINGSIAGNIPKNVAAGEITSITLTRNTNNAMQLAYSSVSQTTTYHLQCTIANNGTGDTIYIDFVMLVNDTLIIDCLNKNVTHYENGANAIGALSTNTKRNYWLTIEPPTANGGVASGDSFTFTDTNTGNVTIVTNYRDRIV